MAAECSLRTSGMGCRPTVQNTKFSICPKKSWLCSTQGRLQPPRSPLQLIHLCLINVEQTRRKFVASPLYSSYSGPWLQRPLAISDWNRVDRDVKLCSLLLSARVIRRISWFDIFFHLKKSEQFIENSELIAILQFWMRSNIPLFLAECFPAITILINVIMYMCDWCFPSLLWHCWWLTRKEAHPVCKNFLCQKLAGVCIQNQPLLE